MVVIFNCESVLSTQYIECCATTVLTMFESRFFPAIFIDKIPQRSGFCLPLINVLMSRNYKKLVM